MMPDPQEIRADALEAELRSMQSLIEAAVRKAILGERTRCWMIASRYSMQLANEIDAPEEQ